MSKYYKNKRHKKSNSKSVTMIIITSLLIIAVLGGAATLFRGDEKENVSEYKIVYFIPSDDWNSDGSLYGAWCWSESGLPGSKFILATDENEDGVFEFKIHKDYTGVNFIDLKPDTDSLGLNWSNKREQTDNIDLPVDDNIYYHQYANEWTSSSEILWDVSTEDVSVTLTVSDSYAFDYYVYVFDKTGKAEAQFIAMTQNGDTSYVATIPAGYTHLIFLNSDGTWDNVDWQTEDLIIPVDGSTYDTSSGSWR